MEKKWDTVIPADLKRLFVSGTYMFRRYERVKMELEELRVVSSGISWCLP
jgi:hypothetical protein